MTLLIAYLLLSFLEAPWWMYVGTAFVWAAHVYWNAYLTAWGLEVKL